MSSLAASASLADLATIQFQENHRRHETRAFVPIDERMVFYQPESITCREIKKALACRS